MKLVFLYTSRLDPCPLPWHLSRSFPRIRTLRHDCNNCSRLHEPEAVVSGADPDAAQLLGRQGLRRPAAIRHGSRRRYLPPGNDIARARAEALEGRLCATIAPPVRWSLW